MHALGIKPLINLQHIIKAGQAGKGAIQLKMLELVNDYHTNQNSGHTHQFIYWN